MADRFVVIPGRRAAPSPEPKLLKTHDYGFRTASLYSASGMTLKPFPERIPFQWKRNSLWLSFSGRIFCGEPVPTSPENALTISILHVDEIKPVGRGDWAAGRAVARL